MKIEKQIKEYIYNGYLAIARRLSEAQTMAILAVLVGLCAGVGAYIFNTLLHTITHSLTSWTPNDQAQWLYLIYPAIGIILSTLFVKYVVKDGISEGVTRVLYAMSRTDSPIRRLWRYWVLSVVCALVSEHLSSTRCCMQSPSY